MSLQRISLIACVISAGLLGFANLGSVTPVKASAGATLDEMPAPAELARAQELSTAFRWVSKKTLPAIVSIRSVRKLNQQQTMADPFQGSPFGRQFGGTPFGDLFGDLSERMREQQGQQGQGGGSPGVATGEGSGFIIDSKGVVMTNAHVVRGADEVIVSLSDGTDYKATDVKADDFADVAVVRINPDKPLPTVPLGDDAQVEIGDWVLAFGSPFGLDSTVTQGIISAKSRGLKNLPSRQEFLQTDAAINPGNSGGPLVNMRGEVIGINTAIETRSGGYDGIGFAVPVSLARWVGDQLLTDGKVRRAYLGVTPEDLNTELVGALELGSRRGVVVAEVRKNSPADKAGVKVQDVIVRLNNREISSRQQLIAIAERLKIGEKYGMVVIRDGKEVTLDVTAAEFPQEVAQADSSEADGLAVQVQPLTAELAEQLEIEGEGGLVVTSVSRSGIGARIGLRPGSVLVRIGKTDLKTLEDLQQGLAAARERGQLVLLVRTPSGTQLVSVPFK